MNLSRICRLLKLIGLLQAGEGRSTESLARECDVSRRTVFRDLNTLRAAGVPLVFDEEERHHISGTYYLPPTNFTPDEALALIVLSHELGDRMGVPFLDPARSAAVKLQSALPARLRDQLRRMTGSVRIRPPPRNPLDGQRPIYQQLLDAIAVRRSVRIRYHSLTEWKEIRTRLDPYRQLFSRRSWYAIGRSSLHRSTRTFNVGRIRSIEPLEEQYRIPRGFSIERYLRNAWHLIPERGRDCQVVVRFDKMVAQNVAEVAWHKTQQLTFRDDGSLEFRVTVSGLNEISWWILGYGDQAEVLEPARLRSLVADRVAQMARRYGVC
jgi:predicted DNA-binding transcriptional regulator YafY